MSHSCMNVSDCFGRVLNVPGARVTLVDLQPNVTYGATGLEVHDSAGKLLYSDRALRHSGAFDAMLAQACEAIGVDRSAKARS